MNIPNPITIETPIIAPGEVFQGIFELLVLLVLKSARGAEGPEVSSCRLGAMDGETVGEFVKSVGINVGDRVDFEGEADGGRDGVLVGVSDGD
jgi:hypothetical protein